MSLESMKVDLSGQNAIVTGASQGLGRHMAVALAASGAKVALVARNEEKLQQTAALIAEAGGQCEVMAADVSQKEAIEKLSTPLPRIGVDCTS
jgi:3-oxoacyl-[acyl-carrier protein] reductase